MLRAVARGTHRERARGHRGGIVDAFPRQVRTIEHCWIPMPDGTRLAARIWLPGDAESAPVPAVLEYIPYRKRDLHARARRADAPLLRGARLRGGARRHAGLGRLRGPPDRRVPRGRSIDDGVEVIAWIAAQPWCTGAVGMMGKSWGGFNALQVAARAPPALRAIMTVCSTDDRYADDAHYMGGCLLNENLTGASRSST